LIFKGESSINSVSLEKVSIDKTGRINFDLSFSFNRAQLE